METFLQLTCIVLFFLFVKRLIFPVVGVRTVREAIGRGAPVIDVRSQAEYRSGALPGTLNVPLDRLTEGIEAVVPDKSSPVVLHCLSGTRSGAARRQLKNMGYTEVYNLGGVLRARGILKRIQGTPRSS